MQSETANPLVSVVTICLNAEKTIRRTIESVINQSYKNIEYIIIDGGSVDGTMQIVNSFSDQIDHSSSERDRGISDAFNKGLRLAKGEFIQFIHGDDWLQADKIKFSVELLTHQQEYGFVFGDIKKMTNGKEEIVQGDPFYSRSISYVMNRVNHPTMLVRKSLYDTYSDFSEEWKIAMDYDWILRVHKAGEKGLYSNKLVVYTTAGGISDKQRFNAFRECREISMRHGLAPFFAYCYFYGRCVKHLLLKVIGAR